MGWLVFKRFFPALLALCALAALPLVAAQRGALTCGEAKVPTIRPALSGEGWRSYCVPCVWANRTFGRVPVIESLEAALTTASAAHAGTTFLYGEIGFPSGEEFPPHRTHREGLSVDILVPLEGGVIPAHAFNRFGYDVEFDAAGHGPAGRIHFAALATLIDALRAEAEARGGRVRRVIFAPDLQPFLFGTEAGRGLAARVAFNSAEAWVRHDDHIHVDFDFPCEGDNG